MVPGIDPLMLAVKDPASMVTLDEPQWDELLRRARRHKLLARLGYQLDDRGLLGQIPEKARERFLGARLSADLNDTDIRHEIHRVLRALDGLEVAVVLLKGAAYLSASLPPARGRVFADLDVLVPKDRIAEVEQALAAGGWRGPELDAYDERYYRAWAHEIPPLKHPARGTEVDVHHSIVPPVSRPTPDTAALLEAAMPLADPRLRILAPADMVLHCAAQLFNEAFETGLRDLLDLGDLLGHFGPREGFWEELVSRAQRHGLQRPLYYALRYTGRELNISIPSATIEAAASAAPPFPVLALMDRLVPLALIPDTPDRPRYAPRFARGLLYVRSHWLRMPALLLAYHLTVKTFFRARDRIRSVRAESVE